MISQSPAGGRIASPAPDWCARSRSHEDFRGSQCWRTCCCTAHGNLVNGWFMRRYVRLGVRRREGELREHARAIAQRLNLVRVLDHRAGELSGGQKKLLEIGRALMAKPKLLLLDEPVAGVNPTLAREIGDHLRGLVADGISVLLIEHHMDTIAALCDPVIVMAEGRHLRQGSFVELAGDPVVQEAYMGRRR